MTAEWIALVVGAIVSVALEVVPGLKEKWTNWEWKRMSLFVLFIGVPLVSVMLICLAGFELPFVVDCSQQGYLDAIVLGFVAFISNQGTFFTGTHRLANARRRAKIL